MGQEVRRKRREAQLIKTGVNGRVKPLDAAAFSLGLF